MSVIYRGWLSRLDVGYDTSHVVNMEMADASIKKTLGITPTIPVCIEGKSRREHFVVQDRPDDNLPIGMTWMTAYSVQLDPVSGKIEVPSGDGSSFVVRGRPASQKVHNSSGQTLCYHQIFCLFALRAEGRRWFHAEGFLPARGFVHPV